MKNKKNIIIIAVIIFIAIAIAVTFLIISLKESKKYPEQPIEQKSLTTSDQSISLDKTEIDNQGDYYLWTISNSVKLDLVEEMVKGLDSKFILSDSSEGAFYVWSNGTDEILYDLTKNYLIFAYSNGIVSEEAEITNNSFTNFVKKYFNENWQYDVFKSEKGNSGETVYYAKRVLSETSTVEVREHYQQTDSLALKDGKIIYGKLLLTQFVKSDITVPLIGVEDLNNYLNLSDYPKEIYPQYSALRESVLSNVDYLGEEFENLANTLNNCKSSSSNVVYLYKSFDQNILTPVYKLDTQCEVAYKEVVYSLPAIAYVNAINPEYLYTPE